MVAYPTGGGMTVRGRASRKRGKSRKRGRARRYVESRGKGQHARARTYQVRNKHGKPKFHVRGWRARRANGTSGLVVGAIALGVGVLASVAASFLIDQALSTQSSTVQDGALLALAGAAAWFIPNPAIVGGVVVGLLLVPAAKLIYGAVPSLASTNAGNPEQVLQTAVSTTPGIATVPGTLTGLGALHRPRMGALHAAGFGGMGALHDMGEALAAGSMGSMRGGLRAVR